MSSVPERTPEINLLEKSPEELDRRWAAFVKRDEPWWRRTQELRKERAERFHRREAQEAEEGQHWYGAAFHLGWLLKDYPDDAALKARHE